MGECTWHSRDCSHKEFRMIHQCERFHTYWNTGLVTCFLSFPLEHSCINFAELKAFTSPPYDITKHPSDDTLHSRCPLWMTRRSISSHFRRSFEQMGESSPSNKLGQLQEKQKIRSHILLIPTFMAESTGERISQFQAKSVSHPHHRQYRQFDFEFGGILLWQIRSLRNNSPAMFAPLGIVDCSNAPRWD